jgi:alpha-amylase/alpha-mannosidase (GH57 family)
MLKVAFLWHMHQPYYRDPATGAMLLPWVRLHGLKDYGDLPARLGKFDRLRMTFNLVPSLLEQIDLYCDRQTTDRHLELSSKPSARLTQPEKAEIFDTFFTANPTTMIDPYPRYRKLYKKLQDCNMNAELAARTSSQQEVRDLVVWSNLVWVDPIYRTRDPFRNLFAKGERYTEEDKLAMIEAQYAILEGIIPTYRSLMDADKIEISFSPYYHPILPLLCDTDSAKQALPGITLPKNRFCHPEDADRQVALAVEMHRDKFGRDLTGMWPSEGSVSEQMAAILIRHGIRWMASDEQVLYGSLVESGLSSNKYTPHAVFSYNAPDGAISLFFRDHALSDRIGFVYSSWDTEKAVDDFMKGLHGLAESLGATTDDAVIPVILDGENCWEYYPDDGDDFLEGLFQKLETDDRIETVTMNQAVERVKPNPLKNIQAGSWINHNFRIWIGHPEDNTAWDFLWEARHALTEFKKKHPDHDPAKIAQAEKSLLVAEGSDWNWWYGDEHRGPQNDIFDRIYRAHLASIYTSLGLKIPKSLLTPISSGFPESYLTEPEGTVTPVIDGKLTHYYEWLGAGKLDCRKAGGAMHRSDPFITQILYVSDQGHLYVRVDFREKAFLVDNPSVKLKIEIVNPGQGDFVFGPDGIVSAPEWAGDPAGISYGVGEIAEIGLKKKIFFPDERGEVFFRVGVIKDSEEVEMWPQGDPIRFQFAGRGEEIVWDL